MISINSTLNRAHDWANSSQPLQTQLVFTRLSGVVCLTLETSVLAYECVKSVIKAAQVLNEISRKFFFAYAPRLAPNYDPVKLSVVKFELKSHLTEVCKRIAGVISTVFLGIIFSPESNFRIHVKGLKLAVDNTELLIRKNQLATEAAEDNANLVNPIRATNAAIREERRQNAREAFRIANSYDPHLSERL